MKKHLCLLLVAVLSFSLTGCQFDLPRPSLPFPFSLMADVTAATDAPATGPAITAAETTVPEATAAATTVPPTTVPPTTAPPATEPSRFPYIQKIISHDQRIFKEPSYDSRYAGTVRTAGRYTIVDERYDSEGNLWGKLKSGAGWVDLTDIERVNASKPVVTAADLNYTPPEPYAYFGVPDAYTTAVIVHAYSDVREVILFHESALEFGFSTDMMIGYLPDMPADTPLVINIEFPGDMTTYILRCELNGQLYHYYLYQNGRNGLVELVPMTP